MSYKVPQDVQREDQILWFMTLKQLILVMIGVGISYWIYVSLSKQYQLGTLETIMVWVPAGICAMFAFLRIKHVSLLHFILLLFEQMLFRSRNRSWVQHGGDPFISMTTRFSMKSEKKQEVLVEQDLSGDRIKKLAEILDGEKSMVQKRKGF